jgi:DnaJ-class molecular chaperone
MSYWEMCQRCEGTGLDDAGEPCPYCHGDGEEEIPDDDDAYGMEDEENELR